jgi:cysteinyl-tRNA synthetase
MNDDFNAPILIANIFEAVTYINKINNNIETITNNDLILLKNELNSFVHDILGIIPEFTENNNNRLTSVMELVLDLRSKARENKDWKTSDQIRDALIKAGIDVKDSKNGTIWQ